MVMGYVSSYIRWWKRPSFATWSPDERFSRTDLDIDHLELGPSWQDV